MSRPPPFAYVFERFPSFTQTFCAREVMELRRQGANPALYSIRDPNDETVRHFPEELRAQVVTLPRPEQLKAEVDALKKQDALPQAFVLTLRHWGERPDKMRIYEAAWTGYRLHQQGVRHVHTHFAGIGARTCWWIRQFFGLSYSFTGHANDLFCPEKDTGVTLDILVRDASLVVAVSDWTAAWLRQKFPREAARIHRVYNGMDVEPVAAGTKDTVKDEPPLILSVGRLIEKKGFGDLIAACGLLKSRGIPFQCRIAGEGPLQAELAQQISDSGMSSEVRLEGALPQSEITRLLGRSRIFALACATERDGGMDVLPTVLMEAMAARLPCVSTRLAGVPEMVEEGITGLLTSERSPAEFAAALESILRDPSAASQKGEAGLERARRLFAKEATARHLLRLLTARGQVKTGPELLRLPGMKMAAACGLVRRFTRTLRPLRHAKEWHG